MKTILITPKDKREFSFLTYLLERLGYDMQVISDEEKEDPGLLAAMVSEKKGEYVSESEVMKAL